MGRTPGCGEEVGQDDLGFDVSDVVGGYVGEYVGDVSGALVGALVGEQSYITVCNAHAELRKTYSRLRRIGMSRMECNLICAGACMAVNTLGEVKIASRSVTL